MSLTYTKLFSSITESTVWCEPDKTRLCWIAMLAMADRKGRVFASIPGLANRARIPVEDARIAIKTFLSPDPDSRTEDFEGRRIESIDGGWRLLNYEKYRAIRDEESVKESKRNYIKARREAERNVENVENVEHCRTPSIQAEAEAEAEAKVNLKSLLEEAKASMSSHDDMSCPVEKIVELYHELMPDNPKCKVLNPARRKAIKARWLEASRLTCNPFGYSTKAEGLKAWRSFFEICSMSRFLTGQAQSPPGKPPFFADIDFLMAPSSFAKCLENKYHRDSDDRPTHTATQH